MKIASIDCGTNSFHLMIGQISAQVRSRSSIAKRTWFGSAIPRSKRRHFPESFLRATEALRTFRKLCDSHQVDATVAVATSATREALNGGDFVRAVRDETGIDLQVISGEEEARLIYLGARSVLPLGNRRALLFDIGGGSVEIMVCDARELYFQRSLKLGVLRLLQMFSREQPSVDERAQLAEFCHRALERLPHRFSASALISSRFRREPGERWPKSVRRLCHAATRHRAAKTKPSKAKSCAFPTSSRWSSACLR